MADTADITTNQDQSTDFTTASSPASSTPGTTTASATGAVPQTTANDLQLPYPTPRVSPLLSGQAESALIDSFNALRKLSNGAANIGYGINPDLKNSVDKAANLYDTISQEYADIHQRILNQNLERPNFMGTEEEIKEHLDEVKDFQAQKMQQLSEIEDQIKNKELDPDHFWHDKGLGNQLLGMIAVALGTYGSSITHSPNVAFNIINQAIERDWEAQKADLTKLLQLHGMVARGMDALNANEQASLALTSNSERLALEHKLGPLTAMIAKLEPLAKAAQTEEQKINIQKTIELLKDEQLKTVAQLGQLHGEVIKAAEPIIQMSIAGNGKPLDPQAMKSAMSVQQAYSNLVSLEKTLQDPKIGATIGSPEALAPLKAARGNLPVISKMAYDLKGASELAKRTETNPELEKARAAIKQAQLGIDALVPNARMSPEMIKSLRDLIGDETSPNKDVILRNVAAAKQRLIEDLYSNMATRAAAGENVTGLMQIYQNMKQLNAKQAASQTKTAKDYGLTPGDVIVGRDGKRYKVLENGLQPLE